MPGAMPVHFIPCYDLVNKLVGKNTVRQLTGFVILLHSSIECQVVRVYGQFCNETLHESRKRKSSGLFVRISTFK